jgi:hypothetical protein
MKRQHHKGLGILLGVPLVLLGLLMLSYFSTSSISFFLGGLCLLLGLLGVYVFRRKGLINWYLMLNTFVLLYLLAEGLWYFQQPGEGISGYNKAAAKYDSQIGYRWTANDVRYFKTSRGRTIFDNHFQLNRQNKVASFDYREKKTDSLKRYILFGDSFMEGIMLAENLPNRIHNLNQQQEKQDFELYSFAMDGGGVLNWEAEFFSEVVPNYEFDAVIVALYMDNLYRDYMIQHLQDSVSYIGRTDTLLEKFDDRWLAKQDIQKGDLVYTDREIDSFISNPKQKSFDWPFKKAIYRFFKGFVNGSNTKQQQKPKDLKTLKKKMGERKWQALESLITYCQSHQKSVILATVPARQLLKEKRSTPNFHQTDVDIISQHFKLPTFDGYAVFEGLSDQQIDSLWLPLDGHWNQKGSNRYAEQLFSYLEQHTISNQ